MPIFAMAGGGLTTLGLLLGAGALLGLWAQGRQRLRGGLSRRTVALGAGQALHVVELEGRRLVIGTGPGAAPRLLTELSRASASASTSESEPGGPGPGPGQGPAPGRSEEPPSDG